MNERGVIQIVLDIMVGWWRWISMVGELIVSDSYVN